MQDGFVGDVCDFGKYGLLRRICHPCFASHPLRLGVAWYFISGAKIGGSKYGYLRKPGEYRDCDPELFDALGAFPPEGRTVANVQSSESVFPSGTVFFRDPVRIGAGREAWFNRARAAVEETDVVFVDPDNGVRNDATSLKHAAWGEIQKLQGGGERSVIVYQHLGQGGGGNGSYACRIINLIGTAREKIDASSAGEICALWLRRGSGVAFIMIPRKEHEKMFKDAVRVLTSAPWNRHFCLVSS